MKSLLQFLLLLALVIVGRQVKDRSRAAEAASTQPVRQHVASMQSFFVQQANYKQLPAEAAAVAEYGRKTNPISLN